MIKEKAMALVAALRSGKYDQCSGALRHDEKSFCCLGVACDISGVGKWKESSEDNEVYPFNYVIEGEYESSILPWQVRNFFGFEDRNGTWEGEAIKVGGTDYDERGHTVPRMATCLTELNDNGWTFAQIADFIEANWERL